MKHIKLFEQFSEINEAAAMVKKVLCVLIIINFNKNNKILWD